MIKSNPQNLTTKLKRRIDGLSIRLFKEDKTPQGKHSMLLIKP